ncbi:hypothetical protein ACKWTF_002404 [Chironomus riparius]
MESSWNSSEKSKLSAVSKLNGLTTKIDKLDHLNVRNVCSLVMDETVVTNRPFASDALSNMTRKRASSYRKRPTRFHSENSNVSSAVKKIQQFSQVVKPGKK